MKKWFRNLWASLFTNLIFAGLMTLVFELVGHYFPQYVSTVAYRYALAFIASTLIANSGIIKLINIVKLFQAHEEIVRGEY